LNIVIKQYLKIVKPIMKRGDEAGGQRGQVKILPRAVVRAPIRLTSYMLGVRSGDYCGVKFAIIHASKAVSPPKFKHSSRTKAIAKA
jgi:hypothetical protein